MTAVILIGIQGSGKTTFCKLQFFTTHIRISLDMLRTRNREQILLDACVRARQPFVIDNTNPTSGTRAKYIAAARDARYHVIAYHFITPLTECLRRNSLREGKERIPAVALHAAVKRLQPPDETEGFDEIYSVELTPENQFVVKQIV
ncbi:MAG TPA: ATP-binding protein [Candidatus Acidoferrales bacterium]|nr:ATP-binding protein [Candidatus Acidoferrales bacterium]